ncbi:uncharacterized protein LOC123310265 [Coccinella septempunctata]|uniref:uncharacterized protein LOC123310265 n=1 Tax=Coccinella septempunctata TaxID=41139 RepID=UPI001D061416|nr:uncharacterized protein LOC123310265 [Coccinella septempunctata]
MAWKQNGCKKRGRGTDIGEQPKEDLLVYLSIEIDRSIEHNRPDTVIWDKVAKTALIIDFTVPQDYNLARAYGEKITKYEMRDIYQLRKVDIMPLIISVNGLIPRKTTEHLKELSLPQNAILWIQKAVILGTVNIIRKVLHPH